MMTVFLLLAVAVFLLTLGAAVTPPRVPLWIPVLILSLIELLRAVPLGR